MDERKFLRTLLKKDPSDSVMEQFSVFCAALKLMDERNARYEDLWKEYGAEDSLMHMRSKAQRCDREFTRHRQGVGLVAAIDCDDAYDLINYTAFYIRNVREGRLTSDG